MKLRAIALLLSLFFILSTLFGCVSIEDFEKDSDSETVSDTEEDKEDGKGTRPPDTGKEDGVPPSTSADASFEIHFIDVGQADAALVICDGETMLIDGGNVADSNLVYSYLRDHSVSHLDYVVSTHAHEDHVGGLSGALSYATVGTVFSPVTSYSTKAFENFVKKVEEQGKSLTVPNPGDQFSLGSAQVTVLGPVMKYEETNDTSIVLRIVFGELSFLFTGDMEKEAEADLIESGAILQSTVLKVGHHGSNTSSSYRFLREVSPTYAVISVGTDNDYGHPHEEVLSRYRDADVILYRTDMQGDIICSSNDGKNLTFATRKNSDAVTNPTEDDKTDSDTQGGTEYAYIGNINSKVYHTMDCSSLPMEKNRIYFITKEEAEAAGYSPCGNCGS